MTLILKASVIAGFFYDWLFLGDSITTQSPHINVFFVFTVIQKIHFTFLLPLLFVC